MLLIFLHLLEATHRRYLSFSPEIFSLMEHDEPWEEWTKKQNALLFAVKKKDKNELNVNCMEGK